MKKFILLLTSVLILCSCTGGKNVRIPIHKGDLRYTITNEHVIVENCVNVDGFGVTHWDLVKVVYREVDTTTIEFIKNRDKIVE